MPRKVSKSSSEPNTPDTPSTSSDVPNISLLTESCVSPDETTRYSTPDFRLFSVDKYLNIEIELDSEKLSSSASDLSRDYRSDNNNRSGPCRKSTKMDASHFLGCHGFRNASQCPRASASPCLSYHSNVSLCLTNRRKFRDSSRRNMFYFYR
ncbi:hypothetical protein ACHWQZ_G016882 [Mnemiopsis leidyi]